HCYGWRPLGTSPRRRNECRTGLQEVRQVKGPHRGAFRWYNGYVLGGGRRVSDQDARALADALERALPAVPGYNATSHKPRAYPMPAAMARMLHDMPRDRVPGSDQFVGPLEWFSGDRKRGLKELIAFSRKGASPSTKSAPGKAWAGRMRALRSGGPRRRRLT